MTSEGSPASDVVEPPPHTPDSTTLDPEAKALDRHVHPFVVAALLATLVVDSTLAAVIAVLNTHYGHGVTHLVGMALWISVAVLNAVAVWNVAKSRTREFASILLAQLTALGLAGYVLLADYQSPSPNVTVRWVAVAVAAAAAGWIAFLIVEAPTSSARTFSRGWKVVSASFVLMSLFSLWLTTSYLPSTERPMVDLTTSLTKVDQNAQSTAVKATITLHNRGLASAVIVGSAYRVVSSSEPSLPFTGPASDASFVSNSDPPIRNELDQGLATEFGFVAPPDESIYGAGVLRSGEIAPMREFLLPGQTWSTEVVFNVPYAPYTTYPTRVRLTAQIALLTDRYLGDTRACQNATTNQLGSNFLREARTAHRATLRAFGAPVPVSPPTSLAPPTTDSSLPFTGPSAKATAPARRETLDYLCVRTALQPQSEVQNLTGNHPSIKTVYVLSGAPHMDASRFPYLVVGYENGAKTSSDEVALRQAQAIDAKNPTAVIESRSEYLVLDPTAKRGQ